VGEEPLLRFEPLFFDAHATPRAAGVTEVAPA
jgi:hypothetical protein